MKNIAIIIPDLIGGGAERAAANLSIELSKYYNVKMILFRSKEVMYPIGGELIVLDEPSKKNVFQRLFVFWKRVKKLRKIKKLNRIETSISFKEGASLVNILSKSKDKVIISIRTYHYKEKYNFFDRMRINFIYAFFNRADKIVSVSKLIEEDLINNYHIKKQKVQTIYNYYNRLKIEKLSEATVSNHADLFNAPVVVTTGRLTYQKGHWYLIRAFSEVVQQIPEAKLVIIGDGELKNTLLDLINELGLSSSVFLLGFQHNPFQYIAKSSLFVMTSLYEGFPNALCEAMACKVPVISTDCKSGPREILSPTSNINAQTSEVDFAEYGILIPAFDGSMRSSSQVLSKQEHILADTIVLLLCDEVLRKYYAQKASERIICFSADHIVSQWKSII